MNLPLALFVVQIDCMFCSECQMLMVEQRGWVVVVVVAFAVSVNYPSLSLFFLLSSLSIVLFPFYAPSLVSDPSHYRDG